MKSKFKKLKFLKFVNSMSCRAGSGYARKISNFKFQITAAMLLLLRAPAHAQVTIDTNLYKSPFTTFGQLISVIISNLYILAGVVVLFLMVFGGLSIIQGAGGGDERKTGQGKQAFTAAVIGFLIIFASYWIIQIVEVVTGVDLLRGTGL